MANHFKFSQVPVVFLLKLFETTERRIPDGGRIFGPALLGPGCGISVTAVMPKDESEEAATHGGALCF